ncbi:MAG: OmpL47-type beta-barrel domain-containing protein, partial [Thermoplasmatota archaeon]
DWETSEKSVTVEWTCTDAGCGVDWVEVRLDDGSYVTVAASERTFSNLAAGEHTVDVRAYDKAGNMVEASVTFTVSDDGGGISALLVGGIVLLVIVVAAIVIMMMRRKKAGSTPPPME